jgi:serine/threonine protein kinase
MTTREPHHIAFTKVATTEKYRAVLKSLSNMGLLVGRGTFALLFHVSIQNSNYVVKVPRYEPSQRMAICLKPSDPECDNLRIEGRIPQGHYLYSTLNNYVKREKAMLEAATHRIPRLFRIVRPNMPQHPKLESVSHIVMQTAVMTLRDTWKQHKLGNLTITNVYLIQVIRQLLFQLAFLHHRGMAHGDLRLANFLVFRSPNDIASVRFNLGPDVDEGQTSLQVRVFTVVDVSFKQGYLELVKLGDYGNAFYLDAYDKRQHRRQYNVLEKVLFQDLDTFVYSGARKEFQRLRDQLLSIREVTRYPDCTYVRR